jgi:hypothetical protein
MKRNTFITRLIALMIITIKPENAKAQLSGISYLIAPTVYYRKPGFEPNFFMLVLTLSITKI